MISKIDPYLYGIVKTENNKQHIHDCLIFTNSFNLTKRFLKNKFKDVQEFPFINAFGIKSDGNNLISLATFQHIQYITASTKVFKQVNIAKQVSNISSLHNQGFYGSGVNIAFIDTGISPHLDFVLGKNKIIYFKDFVNDNNYPYDDEGHGTFVAGVAVGSGIINSKFSGIAPKSNIISLKALNENGETDAFTILKAMQWVFDNHLQYNIKVVCMSFGSLPLGKKDPLCVGAEALWNNGVVVVAAAGNSGPENETIKSPGTSTKVITVGAIDDKRNANSKFEIADFSSRGPAFTFYKPDCVASGVNINGLNGFGQNFYIQLSGTSVATPIVAGLCALLFEKNPKYSPNQIKSLLLKNCDKICGNRNLEGFGLIDAKKL